MGSGELSGCAAIITGGAAGIGGAISRAFLDHGARVLIVDLPSADYAAYDGVDGAVAFHQDVTAPDANERIVEAAVAAFSGVDILVNNAGVAQGSTVETTDDALWDRIMRLNVEAMFKLTRAALPLLKNSARGRIINLGSIMSDMAGPELFAYGTSKHAVAGMTKSMAVDLGRFGVTANYIQPGAIVTELSAPFFADEDFRRYWEEKAPVGRLGQPEDVAAAALFLASEAAGFISGVGLNVDGGAIVKF